MDVVELTPAAARKVKELLTRHSRDGHALRLKVVSGGCSGLRYELAFDAERADSDHVSTQHGVEVAVDAKSAGHVAGTTIDYADGLNESGFRIENPGAGESCGCGESFSP